jgi:hypothetical protein
VPVRGRLRGPAGLASQALPARNGVEIVLLDDPERVRMTRAFIDTHPDLWHEDIGD